MNDRIEEIREKRKGYKELQISNCMATGESDIDYLLSEIDTLQSRLEAAEKVCWQAEQRMFTHEDIWLEEALDNWRKVKEEER